MQRSCWGVGASGKLHSQLSLTRCKKKKTILLRRLRSSRSDEEATTTTRRRGRRMTAATMADNNEHLPPTTTTKNNSEQKHRRRIVVLNHQSLIDPASLPPFCVLIVAAPARLTCFSCSFPMPSFVCCANGRELLLISLQSTHRRCQPQLLPPPSPPPFFFASWAVAGCPPPALSYPPLSSGPCTRDSRDGLSAPQKSQSHVSKRTATNARGAEAPHAPVGTSRGPDGPFRRP